MLNSKILEIEESLKDEFKKIENVCFANSEKVLNAFHKFNLNTSDFNGTLIIVPCLGKEMKERNL